MSIWPGKFKVLGAGLEFWELFGWFWQEFWVLDGNLEFSTFFRWFWSLGSKFGSGVGVFWVVGRKLFFLADF